MKFIKNLQKHSGWIIFVIIVATISGMITIITGVKGVRELYTETIGKRSYEQKLINELSTTVNISLFKKILGTEIIKFQQDKELWQYLFKRYSYYVQAITDNSGTVLFYSITGCDPKKPLTIRPPESREINNKLNKIGSLNKITLHRDTFDSVFDAKNIDPKLFYFLSGATASSYALESYYGGNPSLYQTVYIGINDACSNEVEKMYNYVDTFLTDSIDGVDLSKIVNRDITSFRHEAKINTYAETSPFFDVEKLILEDYFSVGPDRVMVRVLR